MKDSKVNGNKYFPNVICFVNYTVVCPLNIMSNIHPVKLY